LGGDVLGLAQAGVAARDAVEQLALQRERGGGQGAGGGEIDVACAQGLLRGLV